MADVVGKPNAGNAVLRVANENGSGGFQARRVLSERAIGAKLSALLAGLRGIAGRENVSVDEATLVAHANNANQLFGLKPRVVVFVEREEQVKQVLECMREVNAGEDGNVFSLVFAAGRSNRVGAALGDVVVRPRNYEEWNVEESYDVRRGTVEVPLGVTFERFLEALKTIDASGPRDVEGYPPSSKMFCHVVGAAAMSSGASAMKGGTMRDMVDAVKTVLPSGEESWSDDAEAIKETGVYERMKHLLDGVQDFLNECENGTFRGGVERLFEQNGIFRGRWKLLDALCTQVREDFEAGRTTTLKSILAFGDVVKSVCGYDLSELSAWSEKPSLTKLMVGSEGTLAGITRVRMKTVPASKHVATARMYFESVEKAQEAVLKMRNMVAGGEVGLPAGVEFMDAEALDVVRKAGKFSIPSKAKAMLLIDLSGEKIGAVGGEGRKIVEAMRALAFDVGEGFSFDAKKREELWKARRAMAGLTQRSGAQDCFSAAFIEDVAIPTEKLVEFHAFLKKYFSELGLGVITFGHVERKDVNLHANVPMSVEQARELDLKKIAGIVYAKAVELGGTCTAEHGIGSSYRREFWVKEEGKLRYELMRAIRDYVFQASWLNDGCMFPNRIVDAGRYAGVRERPARIAAKCTSDRKCDGACPAGLEPSSVPLWARAVELGELSVRELKEKIRDCLGCGKCETICDAGVSPRDLVWELREKAGGPNAVKRVMLAGLDALASSQIARVFSVVFGDFALGIDSDGQKLFEEARKRGGKVHASGTVVYFPGCFAAATGIDVRETMGVLEMLGKKVVVPMQVDCCGLPFLANGARGKFEEKARGTVEMLKRYAGDDRVEAIVTACSSCEHALTHLYPKQGIEEIGARVMGLGAYAVSMGVNGLKVRNAAYHQPCHQLNPVNAELALQGLPSECCGMGGTTGLFNGNQMRRIREKRMKAIAERNVRTVVTDCPMCAFNLGRAFKEEGKDRRAVSLARVLHDTLIRS
ncbi:FAD-binding oxidoreductase [Candidatus Micrarchaeota archaeon]|nr:FAD-binding oxidoreductase [Candidatus Micrarchaeota archaeon]